MTDAKESSIAPRRRLTPSLGPALESVESVEKVNEKQSELLWVVFAFFCLEWIIYLRRARTSRRRGPS